MISLENIFFAGPVIRRAGIFDKLIGIASYGVYGQETCPYHGIVTSIYPYRDFITDPNVSFEIVYIDQYKQCDNVRSLTSDGI